MQNLKNRIELLTAELDASYANVQSLAALELLRRSYHAKDGTITLLAEKFKQLPLDQKKIVGPLLQELKKHAEQLHEKAKVLLEHEQLQKELLAKKNFDVTAYKTPSWHGGLHIYTHIINKLEDIFVSMGFAMVSGPEVETDFYNFQALNIPADHPARDLQDTFWLSQADLLLRTHTSSVQIRTMEKQTPPFAIFAPGRVYRNEATDATHDFMFYQGEALLIDKNISVANLLAIARAFLQEFFEKKDLKIRVRPGYFPFVEPGLEIDASCPFCATGCHVCKYSTWIELLGSGLVHPNVLRSCSIDPTVYSGFAFGFGIDRLAMVKYGITDIRLFRSGGLDFLQQF